MTAEEIVVAALSRAAEFSDTVPATRSVYYRRISARHAQLFAKMGSWSAAFTSFDDTADVVDGEIDLASLSVPLAELSEIIVESSLDYGKGEHVNIIPVNDPEGHLPPRVYWRGGKTLVGWSDDLDGVTSVRVFGTRMADELGADDEPLLPVAFHELLVVDLARFMATVMVSIPNNTSGPALAALQLEEAEMMRDFESYVLNFAGATSSRFGRGLRPTTSPRTEA